MSAGLAETDPANWMAEGACRTRDPELFFPISASDATSEQVEKARSVCHRCDVEARCLRYALQNGVKHGIWGGQTEQERVATLRRARRNAATRPGTTRPRRTR
jgi:WhiB family redox-sensing transcriptional regulator